MDWLVDLSVGMQALTTGGVVPAQLRTAKELYETPCLPDCSLYDAIHGVVQAGYGEEHRFLMRLASKSPLLRDTAADVQDRFLGAEGTSLAGEDGAPLVLCAITDWVAVSLPSTPRWDRDCLTIEFNELLDDETLLPASELIDNLTRREHAKAIIRRHAEEVARGSDPASLWRNRHAAFPHIAFGPGVEVNLKDCANVLQQVVGKLIDINAAAADWKTDGGAAPPWRTKVTDESLSLEPRHLNARRFKSHRGTTELFTWHARFGGSGRIHMRLDAKIREVEIGYIGPHLPTGREKGRMRLI